ncbi:ankyrin-containing protein [Acanthamoeba polyphaga mimivirus]|uniref:Ankyrin-containing protein n=1 Tax=Acanthamoeba polyphaga mimivirus Kroon TaxID=3069720 RepID=A0A0G2Y658_9VIRU|nr:ankyrin-containing protein [Acanthamoeba polyphaga mimivirus]AKI80024.1 ankyrin-containing protein [Acanthamoeba polyphaga mimivirus Kroon]
MAQSTSSKYSPINFGEYGYNKKFPYCYNATCKNFSKLMWLVINEKSNPGIDGHKKIVKHLKKNKRKINAQNENGWTALMIASVLSNDWSSVKTVKLLLKKGANPNIETYNKSQTALKLAASNVKYASSIETVKLLIQYGANINHKNHLGVSVLHYCYVEYYTKSDNLEVIKLLLSHGMDINSVTYQGNTLLYIVSKVSQKNNSTETVKFLLENNADPNIPNNKGTTTLMVASKYSNSTSNIDTVRLLLDHGANINFTNKHNKTALSKFVSNFYGSNLVTLKFLIERGATDIPIGIDKLSILMVAVSRPYYSENSDNFIKQIKLLLKHFDPNIQCSKGRTVLHYLCSKQVRNFPYVDVIYLLLKAGINPNIKDNQGKSALMFACDNSNLLKNKEIMKLLCTVCTINTIDNSGQSALDYFLGKYKEKYVDIFMIMLEYGAFCVNKKNIEKFKILKCFDYLSKNNKIDKIHDKICDQIKLEAIKHQIRPTSFRMKIISLNWYSRSYQIDKIISWNNFDIIDYLGAIDIDDFRYKISDCMKYID